jgi:hypothetical protein
MELVSGNLKHLYKANNENNIQYFSVKLKVPTCLSVVPKLFNLKLPLYA